MSSESYWRKREEEALQHYIKDEKEYDNRIKEIYQNMLDEAQADIDHFFSRYADKEGITIAEAKKRVSKADIAYYERKAKKYVKQAAKDRLANGGQTDYTGAYFSEKANQEMRLYNLMMKVNRLEMLKAQIGLSLIKGHAELEQFMEEILQGRTEAELIRQAGILGKTIRVNAKMVHSIVNASFHNATFSDRIWANQAVMKADLSKLLQSGLIQGKGTRELAKDLRKYYIGADRLKNGKKGAKYVTERLMRTELARVQTDAQVKSYEEMGFDMFTFHANYGCCEKCEPLDEKHFKLSELQIGKNAPPIHPLCRCAISPYEDNDEYEAWLDYLDKGGTTEEWNAKGKAEWKNKRSHERNDTKEIELSDSTDKWAKEAKKELLKSEQSLGERSKETMEVYDANGTLIMLKRGNSNSVRLSPLEYFKLKDAVVTHNHPSGGSFSVKDIKFLKSTLISELRVSTKECVYYIRRPQQWPKEINTEEKIEKEIFRIKNSLKEKYKKMYNEGKIDKIERYRLFSDEVNKTFAERYGLEYGRETYE